MRLRVKLVIAGAAVLWMVTAGLITIRIFFDWFVVPTNAMAPAIWGRHKDLVCPACNYPYRVSASDERKFSNGSWRQSGVGVVEGTCPMCRYTMNILADSPGGQDFPSKRGDWIWVSTLDYLRAEPQRWDVAVFQYPADPSVNFVKRIVGLPHETVRIAGGDIFVKQRKGEFAIARKPPEIARQMLHIVHDNDYSLSASSDRGWPPRWSATPAQADARGSEVVRWTESDESHGFATSGVGAESCWLCYRHFTPSYEDWQFYEDWQSKSVGMPPPELAIKPRLITDFFAGNTGLVAYGLGGGEGEEPSPPNPEMLGLHWVGDLAVECQLQVQNEKGEVIFALIEGGRSLECRIDVGTGDSRLSVSDAEDFHPAGATKIRAPGTYSILFANVDDQLLVWVDDELVGFDAPTTFDLPPRGPPTAADLQPVRIGSRGAALKVGHLKVYRDTYYIALRLKPSEFAGWPISDFVMPDFPYQPFTRQEVANVLASPEEWPAMVSQRRSVEFELGRDQLLMLGDNSAQSKDSRFWEAEGAPCYVRRDQLVGKVRR